MQRQRAMARDGYELALREDPGNGVLAAGLARLLFETVQPQWTVLKPTGFTSKGETTLKRLEDHSILAGGPIPDGDLYTIEAETDLTRLTAVRLEALTDDSLPRRGPGRRDGRRLASRSGPGTRHLCHAESP